MSTPLPPGQGPIDPRGAFSPPPPPGGAAQMGWTPAGQPTPMGAGPGGPPPQGAASGLPPQMPQGHMPSPGAMPPGQMPPFRQAPPGMYPPPPGMFPPPPFGPMGYPPPPRSGRSFARAIFTTLASTLFGISLLLNIYLLMVSGFMSGLSSQSSTVTQGDPHQKIAAIPIRGLIGDDMVGRLSRMLTVAEKDPDVKAIVLEVDSPGGTVTASDELYHRITRFKAAHPGTPVVVSMGSMAASGGYYLSCAADYVVAQQTTMTGNIGVLMPRFNLSKLCERYGIEETTLHSTGADYKNAGSMFTPEKPEETAYMQALIDQAFQQFKKVVQDGRGSKLTQPMEQIANGKVFLGDEALKLGLVDQVGYADDAYRYAGQAAGLTKATVVRYSEPPSLMQLLTSRSSVDAPQAGMNLSVDRALLEDLLTPRLLYLWQGR